jgi:hypothetical protein
MNARRFVLVTNDTPASPFARMPPLRLAPIAWGKPEPTLARACGASLVAATPKFRFKGLRCLLRCVTA